ncbi:MAG: aldo/keto reductase [Xanthomonadales bacterium]|jgi:voltage-dependent potassium channel beta subunit|nr:aldo/keto reductase [Xanthomonadales bacterium]
MEYRRMGPTGLKLSALSLGSWVTFGRQLGKEQVKSLMAQAFEHGVNFYDNAETYANGEAERLMGQTLHELGWSRDRVVISSKAYFGSTSDPAPTQRGLSRKHLIEACHQALQRLQLDYLDLYYCHRPDPDTPVGEVVETMDLLIRQGKVLYWGTSEWSGVQLREAMDYAERHHRIAPAVEQPQYNLLHRERVEREYAPLYERPGLGLTIWSPLASGILTGKYQNGIPEGTRLQLPGLEWLRERLNADARDTVRRLQPIADSLDLPLAQFAIAWCLKNPRVSSVILGASGAEQLRQNLQSLEALPRLDAAVMARTERALLGL